MSLIDTISKEILQAYKTGEKEKRVLLQTIKSNLLNAQKDLKRDLTDEEETKILRSEVKLREQSKKDYDKGNRQDLFEQADREISIIKKYLPEQLNEQQVERVVKEVIDSGKKEFGAVMGEVMSRIGKQADGSQVARIVKKNLNG